jgi:hypothetical protein
MNDIDAETLIALLKQATLKIKELQAENEQLKEQLSPSKDLENANFKKQFLADLDHLDIFDFYEKQLDASAGKTVAVFEAAIKFNTSESTVRRAIAKYKK